MKEVYDPDVRIGFWGEWELRQWLRFENGLHVKRLPKKPDTTCVLWDGSQAVADIMCEDLPQYPGQFYYVVYWRKPVSGGKEA